MVLTRLVASRLHGNGNFHKLATKGREDKMAMRAIYATGAAILGLAVLSAPAMADDPRDPTMKSPAAIAHDRAVIRQMNKDMLERVQKRDRQYAKGWKAYREAKRGNGAYGRRMESYNREQQRYAEKRRRYEQAMADWHRDVAACRAGDYSSCN